MLQRCIVSDMVCSAAWLRAASAPLGHRLNLLIATMLLTLGRTLDGGEDRPRDSSPVASDRLASVATRRGRDTFCVRGQRVLRQIGHRGEARER